MRREGLVFATLLWSGCTQLLPGDECNACDAGANDAGTFDAGTMDAGRFDAGRDAGPIDAGPIDAGTVDAGTVDAGYDAGMGDAGTPLSVIAASAGGDHTCAIEAGTNDVLCWGENGDGELGGPNAADGFVRVEPSATLAPIEVCTGGAFTCALMSNRLDVYCWGDNGSNQLGRTGSSAPAPIVWTDWAPAADDPIEHIYCGGAHACVRTMDNVLACWGNNGGGRVDPSTGAPNPIVAPRMVGVDTYDAALGLAHTCVITDYSTGTVPSILVLRGVRCRGSNVDGQVMAPGTGGLDEISAGLAYSCAGTSTGLQCWGDNTAPVVSARPSTAPYGMEGGGRHACGLLGTSSDRFVCWGANDLAQLGEANTALTRYEASLVAGNPVVGISAGRSHTCAWTRNGSLWCWGWNFAGQVNPADSTTPISSPWRVTR